MDYLNGAAVTILTGDFRGRPGTVVGSQHADASAIAPAATVLWVVVEVGGKGQLRWFAPDQLTFDLPIKKESAQ